MNSRSLPVRACRRVSGGLLDTVLNNQRVVGLFSKRLIDLKGRRSIARPYFQSLIDSSDYKCLIDPVDIAACEKLVSVTFFGYEFKAGFSVVAGVAVGYRGSDAQNIIDEIYEACSHTISLSESQLIGSNFGPPSLDIKFLVPNSPSPEDVPETLIQDL